MDDSRIARLLEHPAIWRGRSTAPLPVLPSGFAPLDAALPGGGWPRHGLIEILIPRFGSGELELVLPALVALTRQVSARWCVWVDPPFLPFAPALVRRGFVLERLAVVGGARPLWSFEQVLRSGAGEAALAWLRKIAPRDIRRLQLAAAQGRTLGILFRPRRAAREPSAATLRLSVAARAGAVQVTLLKGRGARGVVELALPA